MIGVAFVANGYFSLRDIYVRQVLRTTFGREKAPSHMMICIFLSIYRCKNRRTDSDKIFLYKMVISTTYTNITEKRCFHRNHIACN